MSRFDDYEPESRGWQKPCVTVIADAVLDYAIKNQDPLGCTDHPLDDGAPEHGMVYTEEQVAEAITFLERLGYVRVYELEDEDE